MNLTDIQPLEKWIELEKAINEKTGLDTNVFNVDGVRISDFKAWANKICPAIKDTDKGQSFICAVAHMNLAIIAKNTKKEVIEECDAGLLKLVVPIFVGDEFVGAVGACGMLLDDGEVDDFTINKITGIDEDTIENLSQGIKCIETEKVKALADYINNEIGTIITAFEHQ